MDEARFNTSNFIVNDFFRQYAFFTPVLIINDLVDVTVIIGIS